MNTPIIRISGEKLSLILLFGFRGSQRLEISDCSATIEIYFQCCGNISVYLRTVDTYVYLLKISN